MSTSKERDKVTFEHPMPELGTLEMDNGDGVIYDPDNEDAWLQADESHCIDMDGRWR